MFQVLAPVTVHFTVEARQALGDRVLQAGKAAWREIARCGQGLEFAHLALGFEGVPLALSSRLRTDGVIVIEVGVGTAGQPGRVVPLAALRRAEARVGRR